ncbi:MAG: spirocyclase AveC family protein [Actinomycetota bacterium]
MATIDVAASRARSPIHEGRTWKPAHYLALLGFVFLFWQGWTIVSWLADGPSQVTQFRDSSTASWVAARVYEGISIAMTLGVGTYVIRGCIRERRLTLDAKICIAGALTWWLDSFTNVLEPIWFYSSNWVNVANWCGHMPFVVNPDCGALPQPIFILGMYLTGCLAFAMIMCAIMRRARARWPDISTAKLIGLVFVLGILIDIAFEVPMFRLRLWAFPGSPDELAIMGGTAQKFPAIEILMAGIGFATFAVIRFFKDDAGRSFVERGLEGHSTRVRSTISLLALVGVLNGVWLFATGTQALVGFYADPYRKMAPHLVNEMCDAPGITGTAYGACPGSPGFRAPIRDLP